MTAVCSAAELGRRLDALPRVSLFDAPSRLEPWDRLADAWVRGARILAKRDDLVGPGLGGNKSRQLEYILGRAMSYGADVIVHGGALQSNYCRQLAAACARLGIGCRLVLSDAYDQPADDGSHLLTRLFGAEITLTVLPLGDEHEALKARIAVELQEAGRVPYLITYPQSEILGSLGYVRAALELREQLAALEVRPTAIVTAAVGASYAGLLLGLRLLGERIQVTGFAPLADEYDIRAGVALAMTGALEALGLDMPLRDVVADDDIDVRFDQVGPGYAQPSGDGMAALRDVARHEGVLLDPVYSAKAAAGLRTVLAPAETLVFLHTGGVPAAFAYRNAIARSIDVHEMGVSS